MRTILLILIGLSVVSQAVATQTRFTRDDNTNIVTDTQTHLQWQDNGEAKSTKKNWQEAIDYCEALTLGGKDDWRLPNFNELYYIADRSKYNPALSNIFVNFSSSYYWSSTTNASLTSLAWVVNFNYGNGNNLVKVFSNFVRCVRAGQ